MMTTLTAPACVDADTELFFSDAPKKVAEAKAICANCTEAVACLMNAMMVEGDDSASNRFGVYGGKDRFERAALSKVG